MGRTRIKEKRGEGRVGHGRTVEMTEKERNVPEHNAANPLIFMQQVIEEK